MSLMLLLLSGTCSAMASILLRVAGQLGVAPDALAMTLFTRPMLLRAGALGAYGAGFLLYALALRKIELSVAYPLMVGVTLLEIFVFGLCNNEALTLKTLAGAGLLTAGVFLLYSSGTARS